MNKLSKRAGAVHRELFALGNARLAGEFLVDVEKSRRFSDLTPAHQKLLLDLEKKNFQGGRAKNPGIPGNTP